MILMKTKLSLLTFFIRETHYVEQVNSFLKIRKVERKVLQHDVDRCGTEVQFAVCITIIKKWPKFSKIFNGFENSLTCCAKN